MTILFFKHCGLCSTGTSRMVTAKYNTHGQAKYNYDGRFTFTRNKCSALVQYISDCVVHEHD